MGAIEEALARRREMEAAEAAKPNAEQQTGENSPTFTGELTPPPPPLVLDTPNPPVIPETASLVGNLNTANMTANGQAPKDEIPASRSGPTPAPVEVVPTVVKRATRTFYHLYAGAGVVMPDGTRLTFGGKPGSQGVFMTDKMEETAYLSELANTPGSQVSEDLSGVQDPEFQHDQEEALGDSRRNTLLDLDPNVAAARAGLGRTIAQG